MALCNHSQLSSVALSCVGRDMSQHACNRKRHVGRFSAGVVMSRFDTGAVAMSGVDLRVHVASHQAQGASGCSSAVRVVRGLSCPLRGSPRI